MTMIHGELERRPDGAVEPVHHGEADLHLSPSARKRLLDSARPNTSRAYTRQMDQFMAWCMEQGRASMPATPHTLADYVAHLCDKDPAPAPATIDQAIAAIRTAHRLSGHRRQPDTEGALRILTGYRRERAEAGKRNQRASPPVTIESLRAMIGVCDLTTATGVRDRLVMVLGLALMGRRSELVALTIDDVVEVADGLLITIRTSKTDKYSRGEDVAVFRGTHPLTDPVAAWRDWLKVLEAEGIESGRLLRSVGKSGAIGESLSDGSVNKILRKLAAEAGLDNAERYTAHSLRAGGATVAYAAGVPVSTIAKHGRWHPNSPVVLRYIRSVDIWKDNAMRNVGL